MNGFRDREDAGRQLAVELQSYAAKHPVVLALPRGGVPVGYEIARGLHAPLDVWVVRKVGVPWHEELGAGAVAEGGYLRLNEDVLQAVGISPEELAATIQRKKREVEERVKLFRDGLPRPELRDRTVILVDDGIATGGTVRAAIESIRAQRPAAIVLAVPVAAPEAIEALRPEVERIVCLRTPADLHAIGLWYLDFGQVSDEEVLRFLDRARREQMEAEHAVA